MGGRGASSGIGSRGISGLPEEQKPIDNFPKLSGSEKQIAWANDIRDKVYNSLVSAMYRKENGQPTQAIEQIFSKKDMENWVLEARKAFGGANTSKRITEEKVKNSIEALQTAERQFKALKNLIATETSAKFWIDHRNTHPADPEWKKLRKSIVGY